MLAVKRLVELTGFDHIGPEDVTRVASARDLYHFIRTSSFERGRDGSGFTHLHTEM